MGKNKVNNDVVDVSKTPVSASTYLRNLKLFFGAVALSALAFYTSRDATQHTSSYALCSKTSKDIFTVDELNSKVQCIVIHESYIVDSGDFGMSSL